MYVLDVSAAFAMIEGSAEATALRSLLLNGERIIAPRIFLVESADAIWKSVVFGKKSPEYAAQRLEIITALVDEFHSDSMLVREAFNEAIQYGHSVYDMLYLVLARRSGATLFTLDNKLIETSRQARVDCLELTDFSDMAFGGADFKDTVFSDTNFKDTNFSDTSFKG